MKGQLLYCCLHINAAPMSYPTMLNQHIMKITLLLQLHDQGYLLCIMNFISAVTQ